MMFDMVIFAYLGPETVLPMTSAVAGLVGVVMLFGRSSLRWAKRTFQRFGLMRKSRPKPGARARKIGKGPIGRIESPSREQVRN